MRKPRNKKPGDFERNFCWIWSSHGDGYEKSHILGIYGSVNDWKSTEFSEEHIAYIFRIEEQTKQQNSLKQVANSSAEDGDDMLFWNFA
jgi:hypothetical protein